MAEITIKTNGTIEGTMLSVDGKEISKKEKIISIDFYASAPYKSQYSGETMGGHVAVSYDKTNEDGTIERKTLISGKDRATAGIGQKVKSSDQIIRYIDREADARITELVDKIISHAEENKIAVPDKQVLLNRTEASLIDKCTDLGITVDLVDSSTAETSENEDN